MSPAPEARGPAQTASGGGPNPFGAPSSGESATPEEERQALNEMALEDLGGAGSGGLHVDPAEAEAMRDRALAQYMQRQEEFDRFRQQEAQRHGGQQTQRDEGQQTQRHRGFQPESEEPGSQRGARPSQDHDRLAPSDVHRWEASREGEDPELDELYERLGDLPGVTRTKLEALLNEFDSIEALEKAEPDDLVQVEGIGQRLAAKIVSGLH